MDTTTHAGVGNHYVYMQLIGPGKSSLWQSAWLMDHRAAGEPDAMLGDSMLHCLRDSVSCPSKLKPLHKACKSRFEVMQYQTLPLLVLGLMDGGRYRLACKDRATLGSHWGHRGRTFALSTLPNFAYPAPRSISRRTYSIRQPSSGKRTGAMCMQGEGQESSRSLGLD